MLTSLYIPVEISTRESEYLQLWSDIFVTADGHGRGFRCRCRYRSRNMLHGAGTCWKCNETIDQRLPSGRVNE
jgi:hypothetical protein